MLIEKPMRDGELGTWTMDGATRSRLRAWLRLGPLLAVAIPINGRASPLGEPEFDSVAHLKANVAHGQELFDSCAACHDNQSTGTSDGIVPAIAGQRFRSWPGSSSVSAMEGAATHVCGVSWTMRLTATVLASPMVTLRLLWRFEPSQIGAICAYVSRLNP